MREYLEKSYTYAEYLGLIDGLLREGKTTGPIQSESVVGFTSLNRQRMTRLGRTIGLDGTIKAEVNRLDRKMIWLIITEGWCGDAAQNIPVIEKIAAESDNIETRYILRDENPELIDEFLTSGARSIPKLIAFDAVSLEVLGTWGARPSAAQELYHDLRRQQIAKPLIMENHQRWYNEDKGRSLQAEFVDLLDVWSRAALKNVAVRSA